MTTEIRGPVTDPMPPLVGKIHKWKFKNITGEKIYFINILTGPYEKDTPKIKGIHLFIENEVQYMNIYGTFSSLSVKISDLFYEREFISPNQIFEIQLNFNEPFKPNQYIHFSPADEKEANIIAQIHSNSMNDRRESVPGDTIHIEKPKEEKIMINSSFIGEITPEIDEELLSFFNSVRNESDQDHLNNQEQADIVQVNQKDDIDTLYDIMDDLLDSDEMCEEEENISYTDF